MRVQDLPIRTRLVLLILFSSSLAVVLAAGGFAFYERVSIRSSAEREANALASGLVANTAASLAFQDHEVAEEILQSLSNEPHVLGAFLYDKDDRLFAKFQTESAREVEIDTDKSEGAHFQSQHLRIVRGILLGKERVGTIVLVFDLSELRSQLWNYARIAILVLGLSVLIAFLVSYRSAELIASPLIHLSKIAKQVTSVKDYSVRAELGHGGEIGLLIDSFNGMLREIQIRERSLRESEERYALAARGANDGLWDWNLVTNEIYFSPRWNYMLGYSDQEQWTDPEVWFTHIHPSDRDRVRTELRAHCDGASTEFVSEYRMRHCSGRYIWTLSRGLAVRNELGRAVRIAGSQSDITEGKTADPLTQIPNRLYFMDRLQAAIEAAHEQNSRFAVLFIDLDEFKVVNDSLGHAAGDELLIDVSGRLRNSIRASSQHRVSGESVVARIGGDEFAVLLNPIQSDDEAYTVARRFLSRLEDPVYLEGRPMVISASVGIAFNTAEVKPEDLLRNADTAMYAAKSGGKARVEVFNQGMRERVVTRYETESGLRKAIETNQLLLHYQPIIDLDQKRVWGFEALVRWNHPERGLISPGEFIPIAEESDLIISLGRWVLRQACRQMAVWKERFPFDQRLVMSVNVSSRQLSSSGFLDDVACALSDAELDPTCLALEVTESSIMGNAAKTLKVLQELKRMNIQLEIDDFGTGYSSLSNLQRLPFDILKIDRSFVKALGVEKGSTDILRAILELAHSLKMNVVAEGVETEDQFCQLQGLGSDFVQGYLISKPLDAESAWRLYESQEQYAPLAIIQASAGVLGCAESEFSQVAH